MKFLFLFACVVLAVSASRYIRDPEDPKVIECGGFEGFVDGVYPLTYTAARTIVRSFNYGQGSYNNNERCTVRIYTQNQALNLRITFLHFDLEYQRACSYDSLCLAGHKYCGTSLEGIVFSYSVPANSTFTLLFLSDWSINNSGFEMIVDATVENNLAFTEGYSDGCFDKDAHMEPTPAVEPFFPSTADYNNTSPDYYAFGDYNWSDYNPQPSSQPSSVPDYAYAFDEYEYEK